MARLARGAAVLVPGDPALEDLLRQQWQRAHALAHRTETIVPWAFPRQGAPIGDFRKAWATACVAAGTPGRMPHDVRRTAVGNLERAGIPRAVSMRLTGHKTESVYRRYAIVSESDLTDGIAKLPTLHPSRRAAPKVVLPFKTTDATASSAS